MYNYILAIASLDLLQKGWEIEYLNAKEVRENVEWTHPSFLIDWCLEASVHFILCQGIHCGMIPVWNAMDCKNEILRLQCHTGFPNGLHLQDPVLNADKFEYLCAISTICLPSFKVPLIFDDKALTIVYASMNQFIEKYKGFDYVGKKDFIIKAPFVQNQRGFKMKFFATHEDFISIMHSVYTKFNPTLNKNNVLTTQVFPYLIVQPRIGNTRESKVVLLNGEAKFISSSTKPGLLGVKTAKELLEFAELAVNHLNERTKKAFLSDGITRVDLFCTKDNRLIVNEFESLDANFATSNTALQSQTSEAIVQYYKDKLIKLVDSYL